MVISKREVKEKVASVINSAIGKNVLTSADIQDKETLSDMPIYWSGKLEDAINELEDLQMRIEEAEEHER